MNFDNDTRFTLNSFAQCRPGRVVTIVMDIRYEKSIAEELNASEYKNGEVESMTFRLPNGELLKFSGSLYALSPLYSENGELGIRMIACDVWEKTALLNGKPLGSFKGLEDALLHSELYSVDFCISDFRGQEVFDFTTDMYTVENVYLEVRKNDMPPQTVSSVPIVDVVAEKQHTEVHKLELDLDYELLTLHSAMTKNNPAEIEKSKARLREIYSLLSKYTAPTTTGAR